MKTDKLWVNGSIRRTSEVNEILSDFAHKAGIIGKNFQHMILLTEETLGMANQMLKDFAGEIWLETTPGGYDIILEADVSECSSDMPNKTEGFMAKIAEMLNCSYMFEDVDEMPESENAPVWAGKWSLSAYRDHLRGNSASEVNLDELEKSIVARLANEVTIGIHGHRIRLVISRNV